MADRGVIPVVFDPLITQGALLPLTSAPTDEYEALQALKINCHHRLVLDDQSGRLQGEYTRFFGAQYPAVFRNIHDLLGASKVASRKRTPVDRESIPGLRGQHSSFLLAAIAVEPAYVVTRVRQHLDSRVLVQYLQTNHNIILLSARDFINQLSTGL